MDLKDGLPQIENYMVVCQHPREYLDQTRNDSGGEVESGALVCKWSSIPDL